KKWSMLLRIPKVGARCWLAIWSAIMVLSLLSARAYGAPRTPSIHGSRSIPNLALMKLSAYHKARGDDVTWYLPLESYDKVYASKVFTDSHIERNNGMVVGGSGCGDLKKTLPPEIDEMKPDYSIYPDCDYSIVWFSRGCIRKCPFCVVRQKEGGIRPVDPKPLNPNSGYIVVQDNNFFANPQWHMAIADIILYGLPVTFQGVDVRGIENNQISALAHMRHHGQIKIAWDNPLENIMPDIKRLLAAIKAWRIMCYVLIGYWSTTAQDLRDKETALWADLHAGKQNLQIFDDRFIKAQVQGTQRGLRTSRRLDFQAVFLAEEPYWQSAILNSQTENVISVPHAFSVTNAGNAKTSPIVTVTANTTVTLAKLKHVGQDETMQYDLTLNTTDVLVIDVAAGTVKVNGANKLAGFSGTFWRLDPGLNSLEYDGTQPVDVKVEWRDQWE
ncbi:hypothetical protein LCGC14_2438130, partial [marine sediment metagenome]